MSTPASPAQRYAAFRAAERGWPGTLAAFQALYDFTFDDFQRRACKALNGGHGVLVAAPTGSGKTVIGEFAVHLALAGGRKCFYTTPIKALSNQKYGDLVRRYGPDQVGLLTGDNSINGEAPVVVMTTEVLRNMLYGGSATLAGLGYVVLDEVHYLADRFRGAVWEEVIIHLPESVRVVALSATVSNAEEFGDWLAQVRGGTTVIVDEHRPVPLWQHMLAGGQLYDLFAGVRRPGRGGDQQRRAQVNPELLRLARREDWASARGTRAGPAAAAAGGRPGSGRRGGPRSSSGWTRPGCCPRSRSSSAGPAATPRSASAWTRAAADHAGRGGGHHRDRASGAPRDIPESDLPVLGYREWLTGLQRGIAAHHAGLLPTFKEVVEELFEAGPGAGRVRHRDAGPGHQHAGPDGGHRAAGQVERRERTPTLTPGEYTQLTGRAGRRGIDVEGHAVVLWQPGRGPGWR